METKSEGALETLKTFEENIVNGGKIEHRDCQVLKSHIEKTKSKLGILEGKMVVTFNHDFKLTMDDFWGL